MVQLALVLDDVQVVYLGVVVDGAHLLRAPVLRAAHHRRDQLVVDEEVRLVRGRVTPGLCAALLQHRDAVETRLEGLFHEGLEQDLLAVNLVESQQQQGTTSLAIPAFISRTALRCSTPFAAVSKFASTTRTYSTRMRNFDLRSCTSFCVLLGCGRVSVHTVLYIAWLNCVSLLLLSLSSRRILLTFSYAHGHKITSLSAWNGVL